MGGGLTNLDTGGFEGYPQEFNGKEECNEHSHQQLSQQQPPLATSYEYHVKEGNEPPMTTYDYRDKDEADTDIIEEKKEDYEEWDPEDSICLGPFPGLTFRVISTVILTVIF